MLRGTARSGRGVPRNRRPHRVRIGGRRPGRPERPVARRLSLDQHRVGPRRDAGRLCAGGVSGAHLNPAVTVALAVHRQFPWSKVLPYIAARSRARLSPRPSSTSDLSGSVVRLRRRHAHGGRRHRHRRHLRDVSADFLRSSRTARRPGRRHDAADGGACCHRSDERRAAGRLTRPLVGLLVVGIGVAFGFNAGYAINPARDFGPRLFTFVAGWGSGVFTAGNGWWWVPIVAPVVGAILGACSTTRSSTSITWRRTARRDANTSSPSIKARPPAARSCSAATAASWRRRSRSSADLPRPRPRRARSGGDLVLAARRPPGRRWRKPKLAAGDIAAIGITNQRETTVLWERGDGQAGRQRDRLAKPRHRADLRAAEGGRARADCSASKPASSSTPISPARRSSTCSTRSPGCAARAERGEILFGTVDSFLIWRLTGGKRHVTDVSNASRTLLFNIHTLDWDDELLQLLGVPRAMLPEVRPSSEVYGETDADAVRRGRFRSPATRATSRRRRSARPASSRAAAKNTYGTGCFLLLNTGDQPVASQNGLLTTVGWQVGGEADVLPGRLRVHRRRGRAVAARRPGRDHALGRCRDAGGAACPIPTASTSCRRSSAWARRTGIRTPAARSSA